VVVLFFVISAMVFFGIQSEEINETIKEQLKEIVEQFEGLGLFQTIFKILVNNSLVSFFGIVLGVFFGIVTLSLILTNAYVIGFVARGAVNEAGFGILWTLVPHGIFELPAVFISFALGIKLGMFFISKNSWEELKSRFNNSMKVFVLIIVPLLVFAAIIEGFLIYFLS
jgi:stage II sporulation protein M